MSSLTLQKRHEEAKKRRLTQAFQRRCRNCFGPILNRNGNAVFCCEICRNKYHYRVKKKQSKSIKRETIDRSVQLNALAVLRDEREKKEAKKRKKALAVSPDIKSMIPVIIDKRTTIYIQKGQDPEIAKTNFFNRYNYGSYC